MADRQEKLDFSALIDAILQVHKHLAISLSPSTSLNYQSD